MTSNSIATTNALLDKLRDVLNLPGKHYTEITLQLTGSGTFPQLRTVQYITVEQAEAVAEVMRSYDLIERPQP